MVKRPVLLDSQLRETSILYPTKATLTLNMTGPSECSLTLPKDAPRIDMHAWVKVFNQNGFVGIFRRTSSSHNAPLDVTVQLRHGIDILQDSLWQEETEFTGTTAEFIAAILDHQTALVNGQQPWVLASCADATQIEEKKISYNNLWDLLRSLEDESGDYYFTYDQSVFPWRLSYVRKDNTPMSEFRLSRNLTRIRINENDSELCTRLILNVNQMQTITDPDAGDSREENQSTKIVYNNTAAQAVYGIVTKTTDIDLKDHPEGAAAFAQKFMAARSAPVLQIQADGYDLKGLTGFDWDEQHIGRMCRVALPSYDTWFTERVVSVQYPNLLDQPTVISVSLANALPKLTHSAASMAKESSSNAAASRELEREQASTSSKANLTLIRSDTANDIFRQAGLVIDPSGVLIFAKEGLFDEKFAQIDVRSDQIEATVHSTAEGLDSKITQTAGQIRSEVTDSINNVESHITQTASEIRSEVEDKESGLKSEIKQTADAVEVNAKNIKLIADDYVTANRLSTEISSVKSEFASHIVTDEIDAGDGSFNTLWGGALKVGGGSASAVWHTFSVDGTQVAQFLGTADVNFDRAAARAEGAAAVTLSSQGWQSGGRNVVTASNGKTYTVNLPAFSTSGGTTWTSDHKTTVYFSTASVSGPLASVVVDASSIAGDEQAAYNRGWTAGVGYCYNNTHLNGNVITGPNETGTGTETWYTITADVGGEWSAGGGFTAHGYANVNGTTVASRTRTYT